MPAPWMLLPFALVPLLTGSDPDIDTASLLREMTDLDRLTRPASYRTVQFSSYDRASRTADDPEGWFANGDRGHYLREEAGRFVLAEAEGPGAIVRIWSANPGGTLRIELDGRVVLEEDFRALLAGEIDGFPPPFGAVRARGGNLYYPFPYREQMRVSCSEGDQYFQVNVRAYPAGTEVTTWTHEDAPELPSLSSLSSVSPEDGASIGERTTEPRLTGPGVVRRLEIDLPDDEDALRRETLEIRVDGETTVLAPLGDFFGTAPGRNPYRALPMGITADGVGWCAFPMPFDASFEVRAPRPVRLRVTDDRRPYRFHALWRGDPALPTRPMRDWSVVHVRGEGRLVGCSLSVTNPVKGWWGEGDEKIFVDGEPFPSTFGTGTEDYFGYAWCDTALFDAPYHAQSRCDGPINRGHCAINRFHVLDDVPFGESLRFDMEVWHWVDCTMAYATTAYFYAAPGATHDVPPPPDAARAIMTLPPIARVAGAIEGESFRVVARSAGTAAPQDLGFTDGFSGESHLWWRDAGPGDTLTLSFESPLGGDRTLVTRLTRAPDYGIVALSVNGHRLTERLDLYAARVEPDEERTFDGVPLAAGENELTIRIVGSNPAARPQNHMFGVDYVRVPE